MKAIQKNGSIKIYKVLPETWDSASGHIINFRQASNEVLKENGFYDVVKPGYDPSKQNKGGLYFDEANEIFTYDVTDIDFDQDVYILDEEGNVTGTEKRYKIDDIKASKISEIKNKAGELLKPTDWQVVRKVERSIDIDESIATERADVLVEADRLEAEVNVLTSYVEVLEYKIQFFPSEQEVI
jgi:hypothetical protein